MLTEISPQQSGHQLAENARNQEHGARRAVRGAREAQLSGACCSSDARGDARGHPGHADWQNPSSHVALLSLRIDRWVDRWVVDRWVDHLRTRIDKVCHLTLQR